MSGKGTIAILSVSAGAGHVRAAQAIEAAINLDYSGYEAVHLDVMDFVPKLFRKIYSDSYLKVVTRHPELWGYLYHKSDHEERDDSTVRALRIAIERLNTSRLMKALQKLQSDHIICTHFLPPELLSRLISKKEIDTPVWVQVTDFDVHALWIHKHMAGYFAASDEVAWRMRDRGIPGDQIHVTGIPIMPVFSQTFDRIECAQKLGIDPTRPTIALMSGGEGVGGIDALAERLLQIKGNHQVIALAGKNERLLQTLNGLKEKYPNRLSPMGFTKTIEVVMAASDFAVSKPGGLTTSECLAMGLPMVVVSPIPGQEERNADYLLENGAGLKAHDEAGLEFRVMQLLENPKRLREMQANAERIGRPNAARDVIKTVLGDA